MNEKWLIILGLVVIASTWPAYALLHKRFHDVGLPGPYALIILVGGFFMPLVMPLGLMGLAVWPGHPDTNQFGPPPRKK